jgi:hypothetical protein
MRRFTWYLVLVGLAGGALGLIGELLNLSEGVSLAATAIAGAAISMAALRENPLDWFRGSRGGRHPRPLQWRSTAVYFLIFSPVYIALGIVGELTEWSGIALGVTAMVLAPISTAAAHSAPNWFQGSREGRRSNRRPSA